MIILITGANGFIGKNLAALLQQKEDIQLLLYDTTSDYGSLELYCKECDFVFHLAGVNRPERPSDFKEGNTNFTESLISLLKQNNNNCPIVFSSSIQAKLDNDYGQSKQAAEELIWSYGSDTNSPVWVYRLPNVFGKWSRPNYNSVVATFCHNISRGLPIQISDTLANLSLVYIDDVISEFYSRLAKTSNNKQVFSTVEPVYNITLGLLADLLKSFRESRESLFVPNMEDLLTRNLYATYLSFIPEDDFAYSVKTHGDNRGSFTEVLRSLDRGQVSVNVSLQGITKGNHWHHTKNEKFLVVSGVGLVQFRKLGEKEIIKYEVSGDHLQVVEIPPGYTHNIVNLGKDNLITLMWASEVFDPENPDTFYEEV